MCGYLIEKTNWLGSLVVKELTMANLIVHVGVAFDANNHLYVTDYGNHRVQKFEIGGKFMILFGTEGSGNGQLTYPFGITVHNDKVYVTESSWWQIVFQCSS